MRAANKSLCGDRDPQISKSFFAPYISPRTYREAPDDFLAVPQKIRSAGRRRSCDYRGLTAQDHADDDDENEEDEDDDDEEDEEPAVIREPDEC